MCLTWVVYIALEPFVRRRWPGRIISWSRLLAGEFRDPLVGRDVLVGGVIGTGLTLVGILWWLAPAWFGRPPVAPGGIPPDTLLGFREFVHYFLGEALTICLVTGLGSMFLLTLLLIVLRRDWLTACVAWGLLTITLSLSGQNPTIDWPFAGLMAGLVVFALMRLGLLAATSMFLFFFWTSVMPLTSDFSTFYAGSTALTLLTLAALAAYGYRTALAGQPLFRGGFIED
jgi:serine/threonine-protein kinase